MQKIILDSHQIKVQEVLRELASSIEKNSNSYLKKIPRFAFAFGESKTPPFSKGVMMGSSIYIHGDVGRGKSMLMKEFFDSISKTPKLYVHFNSFMRLIHEALRDIRKEKKKYNDELIEAVKRVIIIENKSVELVETNLFFNKKSAKLICLDEFQVLDIADAMLLSRIFSYLFSKNIYVVFTSNSAPIDLYKNGLQRELFLEFVKNVLLPNCKVLSLKGEFDYRERHEKNTFGFDVVSSSLNRRTKVMVETSVERRRNHVETKIHKCFETSVERSRNHVETKDKRKVNLTKRYFINNKKNREEIKRIIENLTASKPLKSSTLKVWGREVIIKKTCGDIAIVDFKDLCQSEHSAADYQVMCQRFSLIFLLRLPKLTDEDINEARRFMLFVDEIYENKTALIISAQTNLREIYAAKNGAESFKRTISRLKEIKSDYYWQNSKIQRSDSLSC